MSFNLVFFFLNSIFYILKNAGLFQPIFGSDMDKLLGLKFYLKI